MVVFIFAFPSSNRLVRAFQLRTPSARSMLAENMAAEGIAVITLSDRRWARPDIKSVSLLPNVLAKQAARSIG